MRNARGIAGLAVGLLAMVASGCAARETRATPAGEEEATRPLLAPSSLGIERSAQQRLLAMVGDREVVLDCVVEVSTAQVTVIGLLPAGQRVFSLRFDGGRVAEERSHQVPAAMQPEQLLADLQLAFWPVEALKSAWRGTAWSVTEPGARTRRLLRSGRMVAEVHYADADPWRGRLWLVNFERDYALSVDSRPIELEP